jgi:hypothetical protein
MFRNNEKRFGLKEESGERKLAHFGGLNKKDSILRQKYFCLSIVAREFTLVIVQASRSGITGTSNLSSLKCERIRSAIEAPHNL